MPFATGSPMVEPEVSRSCDTSIRNNPDREQGPSFVRHLESGDMAKRCA
jgi:hypothetical protein